MAETADAPADVPPVRPALAVLQNDQQALFKPSENERYANEQHLRAGFPDRRAVIEWFQRVIVRTFGHINDAAPVASIADDGVLMSCLVVGQERTRWRPDPLGLEKARLVREEFEADVLRPACNRAYRELREVAGEYIGDEDDAPDYRDLEPGDQQHVAMRPAFQWLDQTQQAALAELWDGFRDREALFDWLHGLDAPTNGAIREDITTLVHRTEAGTRLLLADHPQPRRARQVREDFAIKLLLPAFVEGVTEMSAGELAWSAGYRDQPGGFNE